MNACVLRGEAMHCALSVVAIFLISCLYFKCTELTREYEVLAAERDELRAKARSLCICQ